MTILFTFMSLYYSPYWLNSIFKWILISQFCQRKNFWHRNKRHDNCQNYLTQNIIRNLQEKVKSNVIARETTYEMFIQKLAEGWTNGIEIAILTLCEMFDILIIVLFKRFIWKSDEMPLDEFDICLVVFSKGRYMSASRRDDTKIEVDIPDSIMTTVQCIKLSQYMGLQCNTLERSTIGHSWKRKHAELADHNYSANIEDKDFLNGSNSSSILGM